MKIYQQSRTAVADRIALKLFGSENDSSEQDVAETQEFIEGISLSGEEFVAFVATPELSIPEVRRLFAAMQNGRS